MQRETGGRGGSIPGVGLLLRDGRRSAERVEADPVGAAQHPQPAGDERRGGLVAAPEAQELEALRLIDEVGVVVAEHDAVREDAPVLVGQRPDRIVRRGAVDLRDAERRLGERLAALRRSINGVVSRGAG